MLFGVKTKFIARLLIVLGTLGGCSDLKVFVPPPRFTELKSDLALNDDGDLSIQWGNSATAKNQKVSAYLIELDSSDTTYAFTEAAQTAAPLTFEKFKVERSKSPFLLGEKIESVNNVGMLVKGRLGVGRKYLFQIIEDRTVPKSKTEVYLLQVSFDTKVASSASAADGSITLSWNAVTGANRYRIYSDEAMTKLIGESPINELVLTPLPGQRYKEFFVQPIRGNLISKSVIHIGLNESEARVLRVLATSPDRRYKTGESLDFMVEFSLPVNVFGEASLPLVMDSTKRQAEYVSGTGTKELVFRYVIQEGDDTDRLANDAVLSGEYIDTSDLSVASNLPALLSPDNIKASSSISIDTIPPTAPASLGFNVATTNEGSVTASWQLGTDKHYSSDAIKLCADPQCSQVCSAETLTTTPSKSFAALAEGLHFACAQARDSSGLASPWVASLIPVTVDQTGPSVARIYALEPSGYFRESQMLTLAVEFNENVLVTGDSDLRLRLETGPVDREAVYLSGSGTNTLAFRYTVMAGDNTHDLDILNASALSLGALGSIEDNLGNSASLSLPAPASPLSLAGQSQIVIDTLRPAAPSAISGGGSFSTSTQISVSWTASSDAHFKSHQAKLCTVNTCDSGCLSPTSNASSPVLLNGSNGTQYFACVQGEDLAGNLSFWIPSTTATLIDATAPTVQTVSSSTANGIHEVGIPIDITVQFNEVVMVTNSADLRLSLETGSVDRDATYLSGDGTDTLVFRYVVQAGDGSTDLNYGSTTALSFGASGLIADQAGNTAHINLPALGSPQSLAGQKAIGIDTLPPTNPSNVNLSSSLTNQLGLEFTWTASTDLHLEHYNVKLCQAADCSSSCLAVEEAGQSPFTLDGINGESYYACVQAEDSIGHTSDWIASSSPASIDTTAPVVTNVSSSETNGYFVTGDTIDIQVSFSKDVTVSDGPNLRLQLATLPIARDAVYLSGSGSSILSFRYQVLAGDTAADLEYVGLNSLTLGGSAHVRDAASNEAVLNLPALGSPASLGGQKNLIVDTTLPTTPGTPTFASALSNSTNFDVSWALSTDTHFDTHSLKLCAASDCTSTCSATSTSGTSPLTLSGTEGESYFACVQSRDLAGLTSVWIPSAAPVTIDSIAPTVISVTSTTTDGSLNEGKTISIQVQFSKPVTLTQSGDLALELATGATNRIAHYSSGDGSQTLTFLYSVGAGDESLDLNYRSTAALILGAGGLIKDLAGSNADRTLPDLNSAQSLAGQKALIIDTDTPAAPTITSPADGSYQSTNVTTVSGSSEAGARIELKEGASVIGTTTAVGTSWTMTLDSPLGNGNHTLTATAEDAAGNISVASTALSFQVDTLGPNAPAIDTLNPALVGAVPAITGTREDNVRIKLYANGVEIGEDTSIGTTTWSIIPAQPIDGDYTLTAKAIDPANRESALSSSENLAIDTTPPAVPSNLAFASGLSNSTSLAMTWTNGADAHFKQHNLKLCEDDACSVNCVSSSTAIGSPSTLLGVDQKTYYGCAQSEDELGLTSAWVATASTVQVDSNETSVLRVTASTADGIYKATQSVTVNVVFSRIVDVTDGPNMRLVLETGASDREAVYSTGTGTDTLSFVYTVQATDASNDLNYLSTAAFLLNGATIMDPVPNPANTTLPPTASANSLAGQKAIRIDTAAPTNPSAPGFARTHTNSLSFPLSWSASVDANFDHYNVKICTANDCSTGCISDSTAVTLSRSMTGVHGNSYYGCVQGEDAMNHLSSWVASINPIIVDTASPTISTVSSNLADGSYKTGQVVPILVTFSEPTFITSPNDVQLQLETGATDRFAAYSSGSGTNEWIFNYTVQAGDSSSDLNVFDASALKVTGSGAIKDAANSLAVLTVPTSGVNSLAGSKVLVIDTAAPLAPVISNPANSDYLTSNLTTLSGTSEADATIIVKQGATEIGTVQATGTSWTMTLATALLDGVHNLTATATDAALNISPSSSANIVTVDTTPPLAPVITSTDTLTSDTTPLVSGTSEASMLIKVYASASLVATTNADGSGNWSISSSALADGLYTIKATATDLGSRVSPDSNSVTYTIDNTAPSAPTAVTFATAFSSSTNLSVSWGASTDVHFKHYNAKLCTNSDCATGCLSESTSTSLSHTLVGVSGSTYHACVQGEDDLGRKSAFTASVGTSKVDLTAPTVTSVSSTKSNGTYGLTTTVDLSVVFSESIAVTNTADLGLMMETGATDRRAVYLSHATNVLVFRYTVAAGDNSADLDYVDTGALQLGASGTITDLAGNPAVRTLATPGHANSIAGSKVLIIDTTNPSDPSSVSFPVSITNSLSSTLSWSASTDPNLSRYNTKLCLNSGCSDTCINSANTISLSQSKTGVAGTSYYGCVQAEDTAGNFSNWIASSALTIDTTAAVVTAVNSTKADGPYSTGVSIPISVQFNKIVTVVNGAQIGITLGLSPSDRRIIYASGSNSNTLTFNYIVSAGDTSADLAYANSSALTINAGGSIKDAAGNDANLTLPAQPGAGSLLTNKNIVVDTTAPNAPVITSPANSAYAIANVTSVSGTSEANASITIKDGATTVGTATADGSGNWTSTLSTTLTDGIHSLTATAADAATNLSGASAANSVTVDTTAPAAPVITSVGATTNDNTPTVSGTAEANTTVKVYIAGSTEVASVSSNGAGAWTATLSALADATHSVTAKAVDPGLRSSAASNAISFLIDTVAPTVVSVSASTANGTYPKDAVINPTVTFTEDVTYTVSPTLTLETGASDAVAVYSSGNGSSTLSFAFTVASGHNSADLDYVATTSLAGTLRDAAGNLAILTLPAPAAANSLRANKALVIDGVIPTISTVTSDLANGVYPSTTIVDIKITFSKNVTVSGTPLLALNTSPAKSASYLSGTGSTILIFRYTVAGTDTSSDLEYTATTALTLAGGTIRDAATNNASLTLPALATANSLGGSKNIEIAGTTQAPVLSASASSTNAYVGTAITPINISNSTGNDLTNDSRPITYTCFYDETINATMDSGGTSCSSLSGAAFNTSTGVLSWTPTSTNQPAYDTAKNFEFRVTGTSPANLSGSVIVTARVIRPWSSPIGFTGGTAASYTFDSALIDHSGGTVKLIAKDQKDEANETDWASLSQFGAGKYNSSLWMVKNGTFGACSGNATNCAGSSTSNWIPPQSANIVRIATFDTTITEHLAHPSPGAADCPVVTTAQKKVASKSAYFDGGDYLTTSRVIQDDFTVNVWVKSTQSQSYGGCDDFFDGWGIISLETGGTVNDWGVSHCDGYILAGTGGSADVSVKSLSRINDNIWHMVTFTRKRSTGEMKLYVDGHLQGTATNGTQTLNAASTIYYGRNPPENVGYSGWMDDPLLWNTVLSQAEIGQIYERQNPRNSGQYISRSIDSGYAGAPWTSVSVASNSPTGKELPDNAASETTGNYPSVPSNLMSGNVALLHLNETAGNYMDTSGGGNHGGSPPPSRDNIGVFGKAPYLVPNNHVNLGNNAVLSFGSNSFSSSIWFRTHKTWDAGTSARLFSNGFGATEKGWTTFIYENYPGFGVGCTGGNATGCTAFRGSTVVSDNKWHNLVVVADRGGERLRMYLDGVQETPTILAKGSCGTISGKDINISSCGSLNADRATGYSYLGIHDNFSDKYEGYLDEFAVWNRALTANEAKHLYLRGALRTSFQVRACANANCTDNPSWKGPDGTNQSYFTEMNNKSSPASQSGTVNTGRLNISFADFGLTLTGRYLQYYLALESNDASTLCNYGSAEACSPEIIEVSAGPDHYPVSPRISFDTAIPFYTFNSLAQTLGAAGCSSGVRYQLSLNASSWYYHNGTTWVSADTTYAKANTVAQMNTYGLDFSTMVGRTNLYIRALLGNSGTTQCELDALTLGGNATY